MSSPRTLTALRTHLHAALAPRSTPPLRWVNDARPPALASPTRPRRRPFSSTPTRSSQATWDESDPTETFASATTRAQSSSDPRRRPSTRDGPRNPPRPKNKKTARIEDAAASSKTSRVPPLPPRGDRTVSVSTLAPEHLSSLRLDFLQHKAYAPSEQDLEAWLPAWLSRARSRVEAEEAARIRKERRDVERRDKLDLAWVWQRNEDRKNGVEPDEHTLARDRAVERRMARRAIERADEAKASERKAWKRAGGPEVKRALEREERQQAREQEQIRQRQEQERKRVEQANKPGWRKHQETLRSKFPGGWAPPKRISREAMDLLKTLHRTAPETHTVPVLADKFKISAEAVRRVLRSRFELDPAEKERRERKRKEARELETKGGHGQAWSGQTTREQAEMEELRREQRGET
ncbi:hypothetical protein JCM10212_004687 [Sporobolomyces blumeae]